MNLNIFYSIIVIIMGISLIVIGFLVFVILKFLNTLQLKTINNDLILQQDGILRLIEKTNNLNSSRFKNIEDTITNLGNTTLKNIQDLSSLTNQILEDFSELHCEINDHDCEFCSFKDRCPIINSDNNDSLGFSSEVTPLNGEDSGSSIGCERPSSVEIETPSGETISIDLNSEGYKSLYNILLEQGVPAPVVNVYMGQLKDIIKNKPGCSIKIAMSKSYNPGVSKIKEDKIINPNSKIVKTLEKLFHSDD